MASCQHSLPGYGSAANSSVETKVNPMHNGLIDQTETFSFENGSINGRKK
jgi:hypothetical protein